MVVLYHITRIKPVFFTETISKHRVYNMAKQKNFKRNLFKLYIQIIANSNIIICRAKEIIHTTHNVAFGYACNY